MEHYRPNVGDECGYLASMQAPGSTLAEQVAQAQAEVATWSPERRANCQLEGADQFAPGSTQQAPLKWCSHCGEGITTFCRGKGDKKDCPNFSQQAPEPAGVYPPMPEPIHKAECGGMAWPEAFDEDQMRAFADATHALRECQ